MRLSTPDPIADHPLVCAAIKRDVLAFLAEKGLVATRMNATELATTIVSAKARYFGGPHSTVRGVKRIMVAEAIAAGQVPSVPTRQQLTQRMIEIDLAAD